MTLRRRIEALERAAEPAVPRQLIVDRGRFDRLELGSVVYTRADGETEDTFAKRVHAATGCAILPFDEVDRAL